MSATTLISSFHQHKAITHEAIESVLKNDDLRMELVNHFHQHRDREFALALLDKIVSLRKQGNQGIFFESIMLACYLLGLHQHVEDSLKIWEAKNADFDTYCGVDIQLVVFAGVKKTVEYMRSINSPDAKRAMEYIQSCDQHRNFDDLETYFSKDSIPWFV